MVCSGTFSPQARPVRQRRSGTISGPLAKLWGRALSGPSCGLLLSCWKQQVVFSQPMVFTKLSGRVAPRSRPCETNSEARGAWEGEGPAPESLVPSQRLAAGGGGGGRQGLTSTGQRPKPSRLNDNPPSDTGGDRVGPRGPLDHREPTSPPPAPPTAAWWRCIDLGGSGLRGPWGSGPGHAHPSDFLGGSRSISWGSAEVSFKVPGGSESPPPPPLFSIATPE